MKKIKNQNGGFIQAIILVVILFLIMKYYGVTLTGIWYWLKSLFLSVW
ncbi:MAG: hypothetical protein M3P22_02145 [bacterium]|nr:hypothetical protein [bacterium]